MPAASLWRDSATAGALGSTNPIAARMTHTDTRKPARPPTWATASPTKTRPASDATASAHTMICCGANRRSSTTLNCVVAIRATAPAPNTSANVCWSNP